MASVSSINDMDLDGGVACLDFVNSGLDWQHGVLVERLHGYGDLVTLADKLALLDKKILRQLPGQASQHPKGAQVIFKKALEVRMTMQEVFGCIADGRTQKVNKAALDLFNSAIAGAISKQGFSLREGKLEWGLGKAENDLAQPLDAFILSAYELMRNKDQHLIKRCGRCEWLFLDETKSHRRKWCSMEVCGSRVKSSRYYQRKKLGQ